MMDCHIHNTIVTVRFWPTYNLFSRFLALRNTRAGHDGQYWDDSIKERLLRRRNNNNNNNIILEVKQQKTNILFRESKDTSEDFMPANLDECELTSYLDKQHTKCTSELTYLCTFQ